jgi:hypothetical protein
LNNFNKEGNIVCFQITLDFNKSYIIKPCTYVVCYSYACNLYKLEKVDLVITDTPAFKIFIQKPLKSLSSKRKRLIRCRGFKLFWVVFLLLFKRNVSYIKNISKFRFFAFIKFILMLSQNFICQIKIYICFLHPEQIYIVVLIVNII